MGGTNSKDAAEVYDIEISTLDPVKPDLLIGAFEDYEKGLQINMNTGIDNRYIIIFIILLLTLLLFFNIMKKIRYK